MDTPGILALAGSMASIGRLDPSLRAAAAAALQRHAAALDSVAAEGPATKSPATEGPPEADLAEDGPAEPRVLVSQPRLHLLWKPSGWTVSVCEDDTAMQTEAWRSGGGRPMQDWAAGRFGSEHPLALDGGASNGFVHRLDRGTSGLLLWARTYGGYYAARFEFATMRVFKAYLCACRGLPAAAPRRLDAPLLPVERRGAGSGWRSAAAAGGKGGGRAACTEVLAAGHLLCEEGEGISLLCVLLHTGRRHQIRAHLASEGHPLVGDAAYGGSGLEWCRGMFLHAWRLCLDIGDGPLRRRELLPPPLARALAALAAMEPRARAAASAVRPEGG